MPESARLPLALTTFVLLLPIWMLFAPLALLWLLHQRRQRARGPYEVLTPTMRKTLVSYAQAWIDEAPPAGGWSTYLAQLDRFLLRSRGPRSWLMPVLFTVMEIAPLFTLRAPFTRLSLETRRLLFTRHYLRPGVLAPLGWSRQICRLGWHSTRAAALGGGFVYYGDREVVPAESVVRPVRALAGSTA